MTVIQQTFPRSLRLKRKQKGSEDDYVTVEDYEQNLEVNLSDLLERLHRGSYRPQPPQVASLSPLLAGHRRVAVVYVLTLCVR